MDDRKTLSTELNRLEDLRKASKALNWLVGAMVILSPLIVIYGQREEWPTMTVTCTAATVILLAVKYVVIQKQYSRTCDDVILLAEKREEESGSEREGEVANS